MLDGIKMVTKEQFDRYVKVQQSGKTNMFMIANIQQLTGMSRDDILEIMKNYNELDTKFSVAE